MEEQDESCQSELGAHGSVSVCVSVCVCAHLAQDTMGSGKPSAAQDNMAVWPTSAVAFTSDCQTLMDGATGKEEGKKL